MATRSTIKIETPKFEIYLYRHWDGGPWGTGADLMLLMEKLSRIEPDAKKWGDDDKLNSNTYYERAFRYFYGKYAKTLAPDQYEALLSESEYEDYFYRSGSEYNYVLRVKHDNRLNTFSVTMSVYDTDGNPLEIYGKPVTPVYEKSFSKLENLNYAQFRAWVKSEILKTKMMDGNEFEKVFSEPKKTLENKIRELKRLSR